MEQFFRPDFVQQWPLIISILGVVAAVTAKREFDMLKARGKHRGMDERAERGAKRKSRKFGNNDHGDGLPGQQRGRH